MNWELFKEVMFPGTQGLFWTTVVFWSALAIFAGLEVFIPWFQNMHRGQRWIANFGLGIINIVLLPLAPVSALLAAEWADSHKIGLLNIFEGSWWFFTAVATVLIQSFVAYATHVLMHKVPLLWRVHRVHHFDTAVDVSTGLRTHPIEFFLVLFVGAAAAIIFGLTPWVLIVYQTVDAVFSLFSHANIGFPARLDRLLRIVLVTPRLHAVHHSSYQPETDSNYGTVLTIWDRMFRTLCDKPADRAATPQFGLNEVRDDRAADLWWQLKSPALRLDGGPISLPAQSDPGRY